MLMVKKNLCIFRFHRMLYRTVLNEKLVNLSLRLKHTATKDSILDNLIKTVTFRNAHCTLHRSECISRMVHNNVIHKLSAIL